MGAKWQQPRKHTISVLRPGVVAIYMHTYLLDTLYHCYIYI